MGDENRRKAWFRPKRLGYGWTLAAWQGWLSLLLFVVVILLTMLLASPQDVRSRSIDAFVRIKALLGLSHVQLPLPAILATLAVEVAAFLIFTRAMSSDPRDGRRGD